MPSIHRVSATARAATALLTLGAATTFVGAGLVLAAPAPADVDTDFANQLHTFGIYGQRDYNAWIGKITCQRLDEGLDKDAYASAHFVSLNVARGSTTAQAWQFLDAAITTYCPDQTPVLQTAANQHSGLFSRATRQQEK